jgi:lambda family phage minor tail protein L
MQPTAAISSGTAKTYLAFPIEATEFEYTGTGSLPRPKLRISNINGTITGLMAVTA